MTWTIAHRGASAELPQNTLAAFERAIELGADFVELDVHAAPDGASSSAMTRREEASRASRRRSSSARDGSGSCAS